MRMTFRRFSSLRTCRAKGASSERDYAATQGRAKASRNSVRSGRRLDTDGVGDQPGAAGVGEIVPEPAQRHREPVAQADQEVDVDQAPEGPGGKAGQRQVIDLHDRGGAAGRGEIA